MSKNKLPTPYSLRYGPDRILKFKVTTAMSKVKSRSHPNVAHAHPLTNVPTKNKLLTNYDFRDTTQTRFFRSRPLQQGQRSNPDHGMRLHTYIPDQCINFLPTPYNF